MRYLRQNTATRVTVGPFLDKTDGITPEVALTATNEHLTLMVDDAGVPTLVLDANATASGGNNDMVHVTNDDAGFYDLELTAAQTNYVGRAMLSINYVTDHLPVFHEFMIMPANVYDSLFGTDLLDVNLSKVAETTQTAGDLAALINTVDGVADGIETHVHSTEGKVDTIDGIVDNILAAVDTEIATILAAVDTEVGAIKAKTDNLPASPAATGDIPTAAAITDAVWDEVLDTAHEVAGSASVLLQAAGAAGDPWNTALPGAYGAGTAGKIIGDNVNAPIATIDTVVDAIKTKTDQLVFTVANRVDSNALQVGDKTGYAIGTGGIAAAAFAAGAIDASAINADAAAEIADKLLGRSLAGGADGGRTVADALRILRNKRSISGATLTVMAEDDSTPAWTATIGTGASDPINSVDPA